MVYFRRINIFGQWVFIWGLIEGIFCKLFHYFIKKKKKSVLCKFVNVKKCKFPDGNMKTLNKFLKALHLKEIIGDFSMEETHYLLVHQCVLKTSQVWKYIFIMWQKNVSGR